MEDERGSAVMPDLYMKKPMQLGRKPICIRDSDAGTRHEAGKSERAENRPEYGVTVDLHHGERPMPSAAR